MPLRDSMKRTGEVDARRVHAGLWIDKLLPDEQPSSKCAGPHLAKLARPHLPEGYAEAFELRRRASEALADQFHAVVLEAKVTGRMVIGLGSKGVLEMGLSLDHTWGVPYLPGSALKGLTAAAAHRFGGDGWKKPIGWPEAAGPSDPAQLTDYQVLFGTTGNRGVVTFHDAWWDPTGQQHVPLEMDVMTVHHTDYYQKSAKDINAPTDFDEPVPVPFLSGDGTFVCVLEGPTAWTKVALHWLALGLEQLGLGAKTSSGYGRFTTSPLESPRVKERRLALQELQGSLANFAVNRMDPLVNALKRAAQAGVPPRELWIALDRIDDRSHRQRVADRAGLSARPDAPKNTDPPRPAQAEKAPAPVEAHRAEAVEVEATLDVEGADVFISLASELGAKPRQKARNIVGLSPNSAEGKEFLDRLQQGHHVVRVTVTLDGKKIRQLQGFKPVSSA